MRPWNGDEENLMSRLAVVFALFLATPAGMPAQSNRTIESYQHLSHNGRLLFDTFANDDGLPNDAADYHRLKKSERTTFESITHALESMARLGIIEAVTAIWGEDLGSTEGRDQFRLSLILARGAVDDLLADPAFEKDVFFGIGLGHVKLPNGTVIGKFGADSVRQVGRRPTLQLSWLEDDYTIGEVDIDYREDFDGHNDVGNSDVRDELENGTPHYQLHVKRYGGELVQWWR